MSKDGKYVLCVVEQAHDGPIERQIPRAVCLTKQKEACHTCPNSSFRMNFQVGIGLQEVLCPRWATQEDERERRDPSEYVVVRRGACLLQKPFSFCSSCPNAQSNELPRVTAKWFEEQERAKRIELELDEEERE